jgi:hypothetical protein
VLGTIGWKQRTREGWEGNVAWRGGGARERMKEGCKEGCKVVRMEGRVGKRVAMDGKQKTLAKSSAYREKKKKKERKKERTKRREEKKEIAKGTKVTGTKGTEIRKEQRCRRGKTRNRVFPLGWKCSGECDTTRPMDYITGICRMRERERERTSERRTKNEE